MSPEVWGYPSPEAGAPGPQQIWAETLDHVMAEMRRRSKGHGACSLSAQILNLERTKEGSILLID